MATIFRRATILVICRILDYAMMFIAPVVLVRILDKYQYGQYREFLLYTMLCANLLGMTIKRNLIYFIPQEPDKQKDYLGGTNTLSVLSWFLTVVIIWLARPLILKNTSFDFIGVMVLYLFVFLNFDYLDMYWLAHKRSDYVLYYSVSRVGGRVMSVVLAVYIWRTAEAAVYAMIVFEALKCITVLIFLRWRKLLSFHAKKAIIWPQLVFVVPLAVATAVLFLSQRVGQLLISSLMGVEALAIYSIGCTQVPVIGIVRTAASDVIFPDMAQRNAGNPADGLRLWKRANVIFCFIVFPVAVILFYYAEDFIRILFTDKYLQAVPIFRIYLFLMVRQCFEMGSPLRAMNKNTHFVIGNIVAFVLNIVLVYALFEPLRMIGAAVAAIIADIILALYLLWAILNVYKISISSLLFWKSTFKIAAICACACPILFLNRFFPQFYSAMSVLSIGLFLAVYTTIMYRMNIVEVRLLLDKSWGLIGRKLQLKPS